MFRFRSAIVCAVGVFSLFILAAGSLLAQDEEAKQRPPWFRTDGELADLPIEPEKWLNSSPLDIDDLEGKGIVFWFFEEQCPSCEKRWPALLELAEAHRDDPVLFIAVNSGNPPSQVAAYLKRNKIKWPVIVDQDRSFEQACSVPEISLQNVHKLYTLTAEGEWHQGDYRQFDRVANIASEGGNWHVDPEMIPDDLRKAWTKVEIGDYAAASRAIMRAGKSEDAELKAAAKKLFGVVKRSMDQQLSEIKKQMKSGEKWHAYQALDRYLEAYDGYPIHSAIQDKYDELGGLEEVKAERTAAKKVAAAIRAGSRNTPTAIKRAVEMLEGVVKKYPDTEAAPKAQELLDKVNAEE